MKLLIEDYGKFKDESDILKEDIKRLLEEISSIRSEKDILFLFLENLKCYKEEIEGILF